MVVVAEPVVAVQNLFKRYSGRTVVDDLSFEVHGGEVFALLGPNGAGKTTTVEILEGYRAADEGLVRVLGFDPSHEGASLKPQIGLMLQQGGVHPQVRPLEALRLYASFYADPEEPEALLKLVGLEAAGKTRYRQLSGGERQRLSLALALIGKPRLVFLDEPTAAMDPQARRATWQLLLDLKRRGVTVVLTTHFMEEAERLADRVAIIDRGKLVALGTPERLARMSAAREIRFAAPPGLDVASLGLALARVLSGRVSGVDAATGLPVREVEEGQYVVEAEATPPILAALAAWLAEQDALLTELRVARQSLEDVFLQLTGSAGAEERA